MNHYDAVTLGALEIGQSEALKRKHTELSHYHLLWGLIKNPQARSSKAFKGGLAQVEKKLSGLGSSSSAVPMDQLRASSKLQEWLTVAGASAAQAGKKELDETELIKAMPRIFTDIDLDYKNISQDQDEQEVPSFLVNLNELATAGKLDPVIGRSREIHAVMEILGRRGKNNAVLVGSAGVGKTAIVEGLAEKIVKGEVPDLLKDKVIYSLDLGQLMAGTKYRGDFEERLQNMLKFVKSKAGEVVLFIDEIHQLVGAGKTDGAMDAANLLKPALSRGELNCIGATTDDEYQKYIMGDAALDRRFRPVMVREPSREDAIEILMGLKEKFEAHHGIKISDEAIFNAVILSQQYINNKQLPDKAIDLIDEAASAMKLSAETLPPKLSDIESDIRSEKISMQMIQDKSKREQKRIEIEKMEKDFSEQKKIWEVEVLSMKKVSTLKNSLDKTRFDMEKAERAGNWEEASRLKYSVMPEIMGELEKCGKLWILGKKDVAQVISRQTGIPLDKILKDKQEHILQLEKFLGARVFGQGKALHEISETLLASHAGLTEERRPLGSFLLMGPSGVGKTETARALASFLFDDDDAMIRIDLSEFSEKHSVAKLIGAPAGYVGYDEGGILTEAIRKRPYAVVLFDEVEKAHPDFADIMLQILDDGRLTDNKGRTVSFRNTIILLTTNSKNPERDFKPEVLGRLDGKLVYENLGRETLRAVIAKELKNLNARLVDKNLQVELNSELEQVLAERGYNEQYGARPLKGVFQKLLTRPLSRELLQGSLKSGVLKASWDKTKDEVVWS